MDRMTGERQQRSRYRTNRRGPSRSGQFEGGAEEQVRRMPVSLGIIAPNGKLAGFGGAASAGIQSPRPPLPIWFAALMATHCQARANNEDRDVNWDCVSGWAVYTNRGSEEETIEPLGVCLKGGQSVAVSWVPGDTTYTVEVLRPLDLIV